MIGDKHTNPAATKSESIAVTILTCQCYQIPMHLLGMHLFKTIHLPPLNPRRRSRPPRP